MTASSDNASHLKRNHQFKVIYNSVDTDPVLRGDKVLHARIVTSPSPSSSSSKQQAQLSSDDASTSAVSPPRKSILKQSSGSGNNETALDSSSGTPQQLRQRNPVDAVAAAGDALRHFSSLNREVEQLKQRATAAEASDAYTAGLLSSIVRSLLNRGIYVQYAPILFGTVFVMLIAVSQRMSYETCKYLIAAYIVGLVAMYVQIQFNRDSTTPTDNSNPTTGSGTTVPGDSGAGQEQRRSGRQQSQPQQQRTSAPRRTVNHRPS